MDMKSLNRITVSFAIKRAPAVGPVLKKLAAKVAKGLALPNSFSARNLDYAARGELERLFGTMGQMTPDGRFVVPIHSFIKEPSEWSEVFEIFGLEAKKAQEHDVFERLRLLYPFAGDFIDAFRSKDEIRRFVDNPQNVNDWFALVRGAIGHFVDNRGKITTLSQLGSDWFGDSKKLRSGPLRRQLVLLLAIMEEYDPEDETLVLNGASIYDNPYTSCVTFSAPVELCLKNGIVLDYPAKYHEMGMAVQLPLETVMEMECVVWRGKVRKVTTSENAAPFAMMVPQGVPCVYTAGYPNLAVKILLRKISQCGVECIHAGDADLDGFRIASEVENCIPIIKTPAAEVLQTAPKGTGIKLAPEQIKRIRSHLENPKWEDFRYKDDLRSLLELGRWFEQESFGQILTPVP